MSRPVRIALVGYGKIAKDQHVDAIAATDSVELAAVVSEHGTGAEGLPVFSSIDEMNASDVVVDALSHCNTPSDRYRTARRGVELGYDTLLEKPPFAGLSQCAEIAVLAERRGVVLSTSWHSQHNAAVEAARAWLATRHIRSAEMRWIESAKKWHPGQEWIWKPGGFGVFDPAINGLSILARIIPFGFHVVSSKFEIPSNQAMPIAAELTFGAGDVAFAATARLDFAGGSKEEWTIAVACDDGALELQSGGKTLLIDGEKVCAEPDAEYRSIYAQFARAIADRTSTVDLRPLQLVADAFLLAQRTEADPYTP